jgi:ABC-type glycerol-3-phosphate transport system substrate-binding protein
MKSPRITLAFTLVGALALGGTLAACSSDSGSTDGDKSPSATAAPTLDPNTKVTLNVVGLLPGSTKEAQQALADEVTEFQTENPNITVKTQDYEWKATTFAADLAGGTLPTVFEIPFTDAKTLIANQQIVDMQGYLNQLPYAAEFNKNLLQYGTGQNGDVYAIPAKSIYAVGLHYNRDLFTQAGLDPDKPPTSWDEVRTDAKQISDKLGIAGFMVFTSGNTGGWGLTEQTYSRGGRMEVTDGGKTTVTADNDATVAALKFLQTMRWTDNSLGSNFNLDWSGMNQYFGSGQTAMYPSGSDVLTSLVQSDGVVPADYGLALIPTEGDNSGVLSGGNVAVVAANASAAEKAAAVKWIDFYYMQKLLDKSAAVADAKSLISNKQPVGVPQLPIFDKAQLDTSLGWIDSYINVPKTNVAPFQDGIFDQKIIPEPAKHTQELYAALDSVVQAVLTDKNADIDSLLKGVNTQIQALIDADAK